MPGESLARLAPKIQAAIAPLTGQGEWAPWREHGIMTGVERLLLDGCGVMRGRRLGRGRWMER